MIKLKDLLALTFQTLKKIVVVIKQHAMNMAFGIKVTGLMQNINQVALPHC